MSWVPILWSMSAATCLTLAVISGLVWYWNRPSGAHLLFAVTAASTAALVLDESWIMRAKPPAELGVAVTWAHVPLSFWLVSTSWFVHLFLGAGRRWLAWTITGVGGLSLLIELLMGQNPNFRNITSLRLVEFLGESVTTVGGVPNPAVPFSQLTTFLILVFVADASITAWRRGDRRLALMVGGSVEFFVLIGLTMAMVVRWGNVEIPVLLSPLYLGVVAVMAYELSRDALRAPQLVRELRVREAGLRESEARSLAILRAMPDLMFLQTADGVYIDCHASDPSQLLLPPEQFLGRHMRDVLPPALLRAIEPAIAQAAATAEPVVVEYDLDLPQGNRRFEARVLRARNDQILTLVRDVTEHRRAEAALNESAQRYALATTAGAVGVWDHNLDTNDLYVDATIKALLGFTEAEISNRVEDWSARIHPDDAKAVMTQARASIPGDTDVLEAEHRMVHKDGSLRWFLSHGSVVRGADGTPYRTVGTSVDITERKRSADQFRLALEAATTGMLMVDRTGTIVLVNARVERLFGYRREELIDAPFEMLVPVRLPGRLPEDRGGFQWDDSASPPTSGSHELNGLRKDGNQVPLEIEFSPFHTPEGEFVLCSITDITERKQAEREREKLTGHLQDLAGRLIAAQEVERSRIARDLHDDVSQQLAALSIALSALKRHAAAMPSGADLQEDVARLQERTSTLAESVRDLSHDLHPDVLRHAGLTAALNAYCNGLSLSHTFVVSCSTQGDFSSIAPEPALCLYRITQEAIHNIVKHAQAHHVGVQLLRADAGVELTISDDGKGFDMHAPKGGTGLGLISIVERARLSGGTASIVSAPNEGTQVRVRVPLNPRPTPIDAPDLSGRFAVSG